MSEQARNILGSDAGFKIIFEYATIGIVVVDKRGIIKLANPFAEKLFGYSKGELTGQPLDILIPDNARKAHTKHQEKYFKNPQERAIGVNKELYAKQKDGALFSVEISLGHCELEGETFAVTYITDISVRKKNEEALKKSEEKYHFIFDNTKDMRAIYEVVFDNKRNVVDLIIKETNSIYKEVMQKFGLLGDYDGHSITEMPGDYLQHFKECQEIMKSKQAKTYLHYNPQTEWYMLATIVPIDETHCFAYDSKVEERTETLARVINELASSKKELVANLEKEKELNELKSRFITTASHEFRTPLATILSSVSLIEKYNEREDEEKRKKHIERIQSSVNNLIEILNDFLSLDKLEEGIVRNKPEPLQVDEFVWSVIEENRSILKKQQKVNYHHVSGNPGAEADRQIFKNVILNLFSNAVKYSDEGKIIDITTKVENRFIELIIKDYGIGIPEKDQKFLFTRFFRAKNAINIEGTGLGLNIVKKYVELMKGNISFSSKAEEGSEFIVKIPVKA